MAKKKTVKPKEDNKNPNHKEDFLALLAKASQPKQQPEPK
jgi:hypothetical protein